MAEQTVLVTGGSSDIGRALIARLCQRAGCPLILAHYFKGADSIREIPVPESVTGRIVPIQADLREPASVSEMARRILVDYGAPRHIVHLPAARLRYERFQKIDAQRLHEDLAIQVDSIVTLLQAFLPELRRPPSPESPAGGVNARIVFVLSSVTLGLPPKYLTSYSVVKHALLGLMRAVAVEYGGAGIHINAVSPSMVETQFLREIPAIAIEMAAGAHPLKRNGTVNDVCGAIEFLLSGDADYINGVNLPLTGGLAV